MIIFVLEGLARAVDLSRLNPLVCTHLPPDFRALVERRVASKFHSAPFPIVIIEKQIKAYIVNRRYPLVIARVSRAYMDSSLCSLKRKKKKMIKNDETTVHVGSWKLSIWWDNTADQRIGARL